MFRDNKREIFGFRKYKAYGLASAVIAAFFLMGGVASADEVTSAPSSDTVAHVATSPTEVSADTATVAFGEEVSADNVAVANTVANTATTNTATETPAVASGDRASATDASTTSVAEKAQPTSMNAVSNSETATSESSSDRKDAPSVEIPELKVTRYQTEDGTDVKESEQGFVDAPKTIDNYQFTGVTNMNEGNDVQTHIYAKIVTEVPGDAPQVDIPELRLTRHVSEKGKELLPIEEGSNGPRKTIGDYEYTGRTDVEGGITTHVYAPIRYELPGDAPQYDIPELKVTRHVDEKGKELIETEKGNQPPRKTIGDHEYTGRTTEKNGITTHVYTPIKHEIPGDAPQYDIPELKVTRHVDEKGKELMETEKGNQPPRKTIGDHEYTGRTTEKDGITTHVYTPIKHEVPGDAPIVDVPELKVTRYVNEKGEEIKESEAGFINAPKTIGEYEFTGKTEFNDGKDVQTHIYKLVEKPVTPTPDPKKHETPNPRTPEPKKPETPQPEAPKPIETPKSNDSVVELVDQPQFVKNELPKTGETNSNLALVGVSVLTALGLIGFVKRKREE